MDAYSRKIIGRSINSTDDTHRVTRAPNVAIGNRDPAPAGTVHADPRQFTPWAFGYRIKRAALLPSFGSVGDGLGTR